MSPARASGLVIAACFAAVVPALLPGNFAATIIAFIGFYTLGTLGLQLLMGYAGQISVGHAAFFGIGAYGYGILTTRLGFQPFAAAVASGGANALCALLLGLPIFRLRGHQLALATMAFGIIASTLFTQMTWLTGGALGLSGIPPFSLGGFEFNTDQRSAYLALWTALVVLVLIDNMMRSSLGRSLRAISDNEAVASSLGVNVQACKLFVFALSAVLTGLGGTLYAAYLSFISPDAFRIVLSIQLLLMALIGGLKTVWGAPIGACVIVLLEQGLDFASGENSTAVQIVVKSIAYGVILVCFVIFVPNGVAGLATDMGRNVRRLIGRQGARNQ